MTGYNGLPVVFTEGRGRRPEAVVFRIRGGRWPDIDALDLVVKFTVGSGKKPDFGEVMFAEELAVGRGKRPDLGSVEFAVTFPVAEGKKPDLGTVGFTVKLKDGTGRPEMEFIGYAVALTLGKMPAEIENTGIALMFNVGKGRAEAEEFAKVVGIRLPDSANRELGAGMLELGTLRLATVKGNSEIVIVSVVVPSTTVVVPKSS